MTRTAASADVVIVGCGIVGLAIAERLVANSLSVVLVDQFGIANGPSGASGGLVRAFDPAGDGSWAAEGLDIYLRRGWRGRWPEVRGQGSLTLFGSGGVERAAAGVETIQAAGHSAEILSAAEVCSKFPGLTVPSDFVGLYEDRAGWLPARDVAESMLRDAEPGVTVLESARAAEVVISNSRVSGIRTTEGYVSAQVVVLAAGVGSSDLARTAGVQLPLRSRAVSYCVFEPRTADRDVLPVVVDSTTGAWLRPWNSGTAVLAGVSSSECDVRPTVRAGVSIAELGRVREVVKHRYPRLADADLVGGVTAYDAVAPGEEGSVVVWPEPHGLVTATGWNGGGFKIAPAIGSYSASRIREVIA